MARTAANKKKRARRIKNAIVLIIILLLFIGIPLLLFHYQAFKSNQSIGEVFQEKLDRTSKTDSFPGGNQALDSLGAKIDFLEPKPIGQAFKEPPRIANVTVADLDKDGLPDVIVCDDKNDIVSWIRQYPEGVFTEKVLLRNFVAPAHSQVIDFDKDGDNDIVIAVLGLLMPSNDKIGSVVILENDGKENFKEHIIAQKIARVSDVRAGDLDGDGDLDLAVAQFGYDDGETRWMENLGNWKFKSHILQSLSGPIHVEITDIDHDGDQDIISLVSQEWEQIYCFENLGNKNFQQHLLWGSDNEDFGSSDIYLCDLNKDGNQDILYTNGDAFDYMPPRGKPWHGVQWLENKGNLKFEYHRICTFVGAYNIRPVDIDHDGDIDLFVVSAFNLWDNPNAQSFIWLENLGNNRFLRHNIANAPTHLLTLESGDFNGDGQIDFVTGGMHAYPPFDRMGRVTLWMNNGKLMKNK